MRREMVLFFALAIVLTTAMTAGASGPALETNNNGNRVVWTAHVPYESATLTVAIPGGGVIERTFSATDSISFSPNDVERLEVVDGSYSWQLVLSPVLSSATREKMDAARAADDSTMVAALVERGEIPAVDQLVHSGTFRVANRSLVTDSATEPETQTAELKGSGGVIDRDEATEDQVILDDLIVDGSACIGFDCVNGESFGFDTLRLKENNLRLHFQDTSTSASFPSNDWRIVANDSSNGGGNYLAFEDSNTGRKVFRVDAGAPVNALYVDSAGDVGIGTSTPVVELHAVDGNTPTLRLEQNGSSGFTPQTWDVAGNETNFFVRDVTNGSTLPFRIQPSAPSSSIYIASDGDVGMGTSSPAVPLHVRRTNGTAHLQIEEASSTVAARDIMSLINNGNVRFDLEDTSAGLFWRVATELNATELVITRSGTGNREFVIDSSGNLTLFGNLRVNNDGTCTNPANCVPDYVFSDDYELMTLGDLARFIDHNGHLPNVPSAGDIKEAGTMDMTLMQLRMLEKIEELTLYTLEQQQTIETLSERVAELAAD